MASVHKPSSISVNTFMPAVLACAEPADSKSFQACKKPGAAPGQEDAARACPEETQAKRIVAEAKAQAARILEDAKGQVSNACDRARAEGLAEGRAEAARELGQMKDGMWEVFEEQIGQMRSDSEIRIGRIEQDVLELSLQIAEKILGLELSRNDSAFLSLVLSAMDRFRQGEKISLTVSKNDYWRSIITHFSSSSGEAEDASAVPDDALTDGSCLLESPSGIIDASVAVQLSNIRKALLEDSEETAS